jgi:hypothetical protein
MKGAASASSGGTSMTKQNVPPETGRNRSSGQVNVGSDRSSVSTGNVEVAQMSVR